jgi:hypothetical protein
VEPFLEALDALGYVGIEVGKAAKEVVVGDRNCISFLRMRIRSS